MESMSGRVCVVTGANSGIGKATTFGLARMDATVVLACRRPDRGEEARREITRATGNPNLAVMHLDLAHLASVRRFAEEFAAAYPALHVLVNNAGIYTAKRRVTEDGYEATWQVDYLSHFLLTNLLLDAMKRSAPSRIVNVTSAAHEIGRIAFDDLNLARRWGGLRAYAQAKLAQVLFTRELAGRLAGTRVTVNCMHPGGVRTNWAKGGLGMRMGYYLAWPFMLTPEQGADTAVWLASSSAVDGVGGEYFIKRRPAEPKPIANDAALARRLWDVSEALSGLRTGAA